MIYTTRYSPLLAIYAWGSLEAGGALKQCVPTCTASFKPRGILFTIMIEFLRKLSIGQCIAILYVLALLPIGLSFISDWFYLLAIPNAVFGFFLGHIRND